VGDGARLGGRRSPANTGAPLPEGSGYFTPSVRARASDRLSCSSRAGAVEVGPSGSEGGEQTPAARPAFAPRGRPCAARARSSAGGRPDLVRGGSDGAMGCAGEGRKRVAIERPWAGGPEGVARLRLDRCVRRCAPGGSSQAVGRVPMASTSGSCGPSHVRMRSVLLTETTSNRNTSRPCERWAR
jgi:hypothetical protein